jgi:hypothetical protein
LTHSGQALQKKLDKAAAKKPAAPKAPPANGQAIVQAPAAARPAAGLAPNGAPNNPFSQAAGGAGGAAGSPNGQQAGQELVELIQTMIVPDSWDAIGGPGAIRFFQQGQGAAVRAAAGVPANGAAGNRGGQPAGGAANSPNAQQSARELIDLIQTMIAPDSWDTRGGPGSLRYFELGQVMVIRQTSEIHNRVGQALERLRD